MTLKYFASEQDLKRWLYQTTAEVHTAYNRLSESVLNEAKEIKDPALQKALAEFCDAVAIADQKARKLDKAVIAE